MLNKNNNTLSYGKRTKMVRLVGEFPLGTAFYNLLALFWSGIWSRYNSEIYVKYIYIYFQEMRSHHGHCSLVLQIPC